jgi:hypothetical protein
MNQISSTSFKSKSNKELILKDPNKQLLMQI